MAFKAKALILGEALKGNDDSLQELLLEESGARREIALTRQAIRAKANINKVLEEYEEELEDAAKRVQNAARQKYNVLASVEGKRQYGFSNTKAKKIALDWASKMMAAEESFLAVLYPEVADASGATRQKVKDKLGNSISVAMEP